MTVSLNLSFERSSRKNKRLQVTLSSHGVVVKRIHFGQLGAFTFFDGAPNSKKESYIKRHSVREDWTDPFTAGFHARFVLWSFGEKERS